MTTSRRQQLDLLHKELLAIFDDDIGRPLIATLDAIAWQLDETDDLRGAQLDPAGYPPLPPPFDPDPDLIDHLEGNRRSRDNYRQHAQQTRDEANQ